MSKIPLHGRNQHRQAKIDIETTKTVKTIKTVTIRLNAKQIRMALANAGVDIPDNAKIEFYVRVDDAFDIDDDHPVVVSWEEMKTEEG